MCIKSEFKEVILKLATNGQSDLVFLLTSKLCHQRVVCPWSGAIYVHENIKNMIKSDFKVIFLKLATIDQNDKAFLLTSKFGPQEFVCPCSGAIYMYKII